MDESSVIEQQVVLLQIGPRVPSSFVERTSREIERAFPYAEKVAIGECRQCATTGSFRNLTGSSPFEVMLRIAATHPGVSMLRLYPAGCFLPEFLLRKFARFHTQTANAYSYMDLEEMAFYHTFLEMFSAGLILDLGNRPRPTIPPDDILNAFHLPGASLLQPDEEDARFFMGDHFNEFFGLPRSLNVEISSVCNAHCPMCHFSPENGLGLIDNPPPFMPMDMFKRIVDEVALWPNKPPLDFSWRGEPLMNPDFTSYARKAKEKGLPVLLTTNASRLSGALQEEVLDLELNQVVFSIDAVTPSTYGSIRPGLDFALVKRNVEGFLTLKERKYPAAKTVVTLKAVRQESNDEELDSLVRYWLPRVNNVIIQNKGIYDRKSRTAVSYKPFASKRRNMPCPHPFLLQSITATGRVYDCVLIYDQDDPSSCMGSMVDRTLEEIWRADGITAKRNALLNRETDRIPSCAGCDIPATPATISKIFNGDMLVDRKHYYTSYSRIQKGNGTHLPRAIAVIQQAPEPNSNPGEPPSSDILEGMHHASRQR
jgi:wyosine [tRNA(Phe)-imidazoG37] synthetase (radical SAM superfamily)